MESILKVLIPYLSGLTFVYTATWAIRKKNVLIPYLSGLTFV